MRRSVGVVYLAWAPIGLKPVSSFVESYRRHAAGLDHRLVVIFNGFRRAEDVRATEAVLHDLDFEPVYLPERKIDLAAYFETASRTDAHYLCFFNSYSEILAPAWLQTLYRHVRRADVGLVGATGSYEGSATTRLGKMLDRRRLVPFPNPHIRTNAFMIGRDLMLDLDWRPIRSKREAWQLESGPRSITRQVWGRGLEALVVGRDGIAYPNELWRESQTFRSDEQTNLLVADNRTREFAEAPRRRRRKLVKLAWGKEAVGAGDY